ncbi:glucose 1-dehydrogenase [Streptomyces wuyuanensis]|uniref:glucose 1-dehydrogenase n=1 Tax=Streptomyces wuyuanensis TaxID=1196353 RepID=UPI003418DF3C
MHDKILKDKVAIITGAARGIGRSSAVHFARHGARLLLADLDSEPGEEVAELVRREGGEAAFVRTDVSDAQDVEALVATALQLYGRLDCAFNNAGIDGEASPLSESSEENWDLVTAVDLKGVWLCLKYELRAMVQQGGGSIVNAASAAGTVGLDYGLSAYVAAKHGVIGLTRAAALEYATQGIRVNAVCPGTVRTTMLDDAIRDGIVTEEGAASLQPMRRLGKPKEIARAAAWLCSDQASFITGHAMAVDGGFVAA